MIKAVPAEPVKPVINARLLSHSARYSDESKEDTLAAGFFFDATLPVATYVDPRSLLGC